MTTTSEPKNRLTAEMGRRDSSPRRVFLLLVALGIAVRLLPLFDLGERLLQQWPTEDGYLTLTIARNIALGHGFAVADGTVPTNGTQPLATLIYALGFAVVGGAKSSGVLLAQLWQLGVGVITAFVLYRFVVELFERHAQRAWIACAATGLWFLHPVALPHTMNCLETSTVVLALLLIVRYWLGWIKTCPGSRDLRRAAKLGALMVLAAWARVDSVFFMTALALTHLGVGTLGSRFRAAVAEVSVMATLAALGIFPWLLFGKVQFDHWMPISGVAESYRAQFGDHAALLPAKLFEYTNGVVGVPSAWETHSAVVVLCVALIVCWGWALAWALRHADEVQQQVAALGGLSLLLYGGYYGLFFGADHFLSRYLMPLSPLVFVFTGLCFVHVVRRLPARSGMLAVAVVGLLVLGQQARLYHRGVPHQHWQVTSWVEENVPDDVWIGGIQSGTVGFFHDRMLNLDGKVDARALDALLADRHHDYIVASPVQALVDWYGIVALMQDGEVIADSFVLRVRDPKRNLAVLARRQGPLDVGASADRAGH